MKSNDRESQGFTYDMFETPRQSKNTSRHFLWWCAGAHQQLLRQFPSEQIKYAGLGAVVLATFVLATLSSGYALYTVFGGGVWMLVLALVWGVIIFNFDRFLVSTMRKYGVSRRKQFTMAVPRLLLALLIGITIARPLELKIFEKEIATKMEENLHYNIQKNDSLLLQEHRLNTSDAIAGRERLEARKAAIEDSLSSLQSAYIAEADGTGGSGQRGIERLTRMKQSAFENARAAFAPELKMLDSSTQSYNQQIASAEEVLRQQQDAYAAAARNNMGFLERNKALSDLTEEESSVWWSVLMVSLLIILIETGPVLSKLIMPPGPYDIALAKEELLQMARDEAAISQSRDVLYEKKKSFYQQQKEMSAAVSEKLSALQQKYIDEELEKWEQGQWQSRDHKASMDEVMRKIKKQYHVDEEDML